MKKIHRYILKEMLWPFIFGFLFFNFILFMGIIFDLTQLIFVENAPPLKVIQLILFSLPSFFDIIIPVSLLFAILLSFGRLSADEEIIALRSSGLSFFQIELSILLFAVFLTFTSLLFSAYLTPWCNKRYNKIYQQILLNRPLIELKERTILTFDNKRLYCFDVDEKKQIMRNIVLYEFISPHAQTFPQITLAEEGKVEKEKFVLRKINFYRFDQNCKLSQSGKFSEQIIYLYPKEIFEEKKEKESWEMTFTEIKKKLKDKSLAFRERKRLEIDFHGRIAIPLATFIMCILGIPIGIKMERGDKSISLGISLVVVIVYYVLFLTGEFLAKAGFLSPFLGVWIPNFVFLSLGIWFNIRMIRK